MGNSLRKFLSSKYMTHGHDWPTTLTSSSYMMTKYETISRKYLKIIEAAL